MQLRDDNLRRLDEKVFDVLIVGGGINGASAAAALSGKGVDVALIDRGDFAGGTSMHSSNLVWGGIKYMESGEFSLVRKLCKSRNHLLENYPSAVREIRFLTTIERGFRHHPLVPWLGTWLYWLMGSGFTRLPHYLRPAALKAREPVIETGNALGGFEYSDAYLHDNDARFVFNFVRSALDYGAVAANYVESLGAHREGDLWVVRVHDRIAGTTFDVRSRVLINAAGPWVDEHNQLTHQTTEHRHVFSKGIHLIVPRLTESRRILAFFDDDGRLFFVIPMGPRTCIGTTDTRVDSPEVEVTDEDVSFVLDNINKRLALTTPLNEQDVIATRCGVRPLAVKPNGGGDRDFLNLSRKHAIDVDESGRHLSIFGGKLTDCLNVGEEVVATVQRLGIEVAYPDYRWYGEPPASVRDAFLHRAHLMGLDELTDEQAIEPLSTRLWRRYGLKALDLLEAIHRDPRQGERLIEGADYLRCEFELIRRREMVTRLEDFLRRRSKVEQVVPRTMLRDSPGLEEACTILFGEEAQQRLAEYWSAERGEIEADSVRGKLPS
ncbi:glycerol-3-phosphate dehydrogenase/oxidase [Halomonas elongata]|uniref:glycerol-3-phosphate dehydrogenase/oxidase n=1 Tax=Halomonas elongata TaxID=2746 RepID=UPI00186BAB6C|nr:glycerol-3-phosphate dehydrogenase/oxidase [Halomonas elongata]MBW5799699.1 glycerol-3-phosphate dehydrogenase/oxidase [Halomonas elongata]MDL4863023.1 glycerol-3-phosphate dehydrogenase/oxidase [Halomonas elongata]